MTISKNKSVEEPKVVLAYPAFFKSFKNLFPTLEIVKSERDLIGKDLVIFSGGEDISPSIYGQKDRFCMGVNQRRDEIESSIFRYAKYVGIKMLGVCRGHQFINAHLGGSLVQDIVFDRQVKEYKEYYKNLKYHDRQHPLTEKNGVVGEIFETVNSLHHQGVVYPGQNLRITSIYNGVIESCESDNIITVQFHPEFMLDTQAIKFFQFIKNWALGKEKVKVSRKGIIEPIKLKSISFSADGLENNINEYRRYRNERPQRVEFVIDNNLNLYNQVPSPVEEVPPNIFDEEGEEE